MPDFVEFVEGANATPEGGTRVAVYINDGLKYQAIVPTSSDGVPYSTDNPLPIELATHIVTGNLTALNSVVELNCEGHQGTVVFQVGGTWQGKIVVEGTIDSIYTNLSIVQPGTAIAFTGVNNDNQNGVYRVLITAGYTKIRLRMSSYTSGTAAVIMNGAQLVPTSFVWQLVPENLKALIYGATSDTTYQPFRIDPTTHTIQVLSYEHHELHEGNHFFYEDAVTLASAGVQDYLITTPNTTKYAHLTFRATGNAITEVDFFEATDKTGTTLQTVYNNNRNSSTTATTTIHKGTSGGTTDGTKIGFMKSGSSTGTSSRTNAQAFRDNEIILKRNTKYILRITSGTNDNLTNVVLEWYEHTDKTA